MIKVLEGISADRSAASAAEYALMIALIGGVIVVAAALLGTNISTVFNNFAGKVVYAGT